jgi:dTDP-glucose 4,6-dehydratase
MFYAGKLSTWLHLGSAARDRFRLLTLTTDEVFGSLGEAGSFRETRLTRRIRLSRLSRLHPITSRAYYQTYGLPALITNCSNNYGYF